MQAEANFDSLKKCKALWQRDALTGQIPGSGLSPVRGMYIEESLSEKKAQVDGKNV